MKKIIIMLTILCVCLCSCGESIVGTWENENEGVYAFEGDGTGYVELAGQKADIYWEVEGDNLEIKMEMFGMKVDLFKGAEYEIKGDTLIITTNDKTIEFKKV